METFSHCKLFEAHGQGRRNRGGGGGGQGGTCPPPQFPTPKKCNFSKRKVPIFLSKKCPFKVKHAPFFQVEEKDIFLNI